MVTSRRVTLKDEIVYLCPPQWKGLNFLPEVVINYRSIFMSFDPFQIFWTHLILWPGRRVYIWTSQCLHRTVLPPSSKHSVLISSAVLKRYLNNKPFKKSWEKVVFLTSNSNFLLIAPVYRHSLKKCWSWWLIGSIFFSRKPIVTTLLLHFLIVRDMFTFAIIFQPL